MKIKSSSESVFLFLSLGRPDEDELDDFWKRKIEDRSNRGIQLVFWSDLEITGLALII